MEEMTIVRFVVDKEKRGKEKRWGNWQYYKTESRKTVGNTPVNLLQVDLPGYFYKKKEWPLKKLTGYLRGLDVPEENSHIYYLMEKEAEVFLGRKSKTLPIEFVSLLLQNRWKKVDALIWLGELDTEDKKLVERFVRHTRYIGTVPLQEETEEWQEMLWEEYGFLLEAEGEVSKLHIPKEGRQLWITGREVYGLKPGMLLPGTIFVSREVDGSGKKMCARAQDTKYLDIKCFLESLFP